jgi:polar amino acid transport system substrate-binding protein
MSCSYGPGRYDPAYEEKGHDYPPSHVRWTEKRNMEAFQRLIEAGRLEVSKLTTHVFPLEKAADAYELVLTRSEPFFGVLLEYEPVAGSQGGETGGRSRRLPVTSASSVAGSAGVSFIGAGSYAQGFLLPNLPAPVTAVRRGVATNSGTTSRRVAEKFGFAWCADDPDEILADEDTSVVFITTRHDSHGRLVRAALEAGKHVYVEKPLCLTEEELLAIEDAWTAQDGKIHLMVGFNRRFAPLVTRLKSALRPRPLTAVYRVNAGAIAPDHWIQDPDMGGGAHHR